MATMIYMVRHAESPFKLGEERVRGLSEEGVIAANRVTELLMEKDIAVIVSSSYKRAVHTVQGLALHKGLTIKEYEELKERPIKGLEYKLPEQELLKAIEHSFENKEYCLEGGESTIQAQKRVIPTIIQLLSVYNGKKIVIGTHGNIMTIIMNYFDERYGYDFWKSTSKPDIYKLTFDNKNSLVEVERLWS
ncbi:2,3-bisphosphoglycerate-dependent phosphoglycerate mutase [Gracilibacillus orientalis]|uniref:2,3-bisphosphoglycerate-dependent phosphoglycerate mutase n=2 Tax=Gracilibacillus orientalis TaxID=334253 RepID=A0A1I4Q397_9BACI|nr:2,3-bisphosphoglycerate-dependent phosphoglycerate mutase [Gracilibacillus orientalis]